MKGAFHALEAVIGIVIILISMLSFTGNIVVSPELSLLNAKVKTYEILKELDNVGLLRNYVYSNDVTSLKEEIEGYITREVYVSIFNETTNVTELPVISSEDVVTVSYFLSGKPGDYSPREVRVYLWGFE